MSEQNPNPEVFPPGTTKYFIKEILSNKVTVRLPIRGGGERLVVVPFVDLGDDVGGLEVSEPEQISALRKLVASRRGGVREVNKVEYEEAKKVASVQEQRRVSLRPKSLLNQLVRIDSARTDSLKGNAADRAETVKYPDPSIPSELSQAEVKQPAVVPDSPESRTPKARKKRPDSETPATPTPPLALGGDTVAG